MSEKKEFRPSLSKGRLYSPKEIFKENGSFLRFLAYLANMIMIAFAFFILKDAYGYERFFALLLTTPPVLSIFAIINQGDKEERELKKRIRKAYLRKELKDLSEFDDNV